MRISGLGNKPLPLVLTAFGLLTAGLAMLAGTLWLAKSAYDLEQTGIRTEGVVVALLHHRTGSRSPIFRFHDEMGREQVIRSPGLSRDYAKGDSIPVIYPPGRPQDAEVDDKVMLYSGSAVMAFMAMLCLAIGLVFLKLLTGPRKSKR